MMLKRWVMRNVQGLGLVFSLVVSPHMSLGLNVFLLKA